MSFPQRLSLPLVGSLPAVGRSKSKADSGQALNRMVQGKPE